MSDGVELKQITQKGENTQSHGDETSKVPVVDICNPDRNGVEELKNSVSPSNTEKQDTFDVIIIDEDTTHKKDDEDEDYIPPTEGFALSIHKVRQTIEKTAGENWSMIKWIIIGSILVVYAVYFGFAMSYEFGSEPSVRLLWITVVAIGCIILSLIWKYLGESATEGLEPCTKWCDAHGRIFSWVILLLIYIAVLVFIFVDVFINTKQPQNLISLGGLACYVLLCFLLSYSPAHVNWRAVLWGIAIQFILALLILRWTWGYQAFQWVGDRVSEFLSHSDFGAEFLFGANFRDHFFAFSVLPVIVYFSTAISMLYYLGVMQAVIRKVGWVLQKILGTTAGESLNAAGNIFIGQTEAPLMIRPLLKDMTRSELHAIMTGGFATIAGSVLAAYLAFGVPANHLISASVMSAPAALAMSKLFYPETQVSKTRAEDVQHMEPSTDRNIIDAASRGASSSIKLVANIAVNLIAFLALLHLVNSTLGWLGLRLGWSDPELSFELICSYVFYPLAVIMGTELVDCRMVAEFIGVKTFLNEFVAYERLGKIILNKELLLGHVEVNGTFETVNKNIIMYDFTLPNKSFYSNYTLERGILQDRSEVIATYALCGFANVGSMGIMLGGLGAMAPNRKTDLAGIVLRAMIAGNVACFMTACIAGIFYNPNLSTTEIALFNQLQGVTI